MKPIRCVVNSMQSENFDDPDAPTVVTLVSSDPEKPQHLAVKVHDKADLDVLAQGVAVDVTIAVAKAVPAPAPAAPKV